MNIYLSFEWTSNYISVYSILTSTFTNYQINVSFTSINTIASDGSKIFIGGVNTHSYLISSTLNDLTSNSAIVPNTFTMSNYGSGQADSVAVIIGATLSSTLITCYSYPTPVVAPAVCSNSITRTDAQYFLDTIAYSGLSNNTFYSKPIVLTCSTIWNKKSDGYYKFKKYFKILKYYSNINDL